MASRRAASEIIGDVLGAALGGPRPVLSAEISEELIDLFFDATVAVTEHANGGELGAVKRNEYRSKAEERVRQLLDAGDTEALAEATLQAERAIKHYGGDSNP